MLKIISKDENEVTFEFQKGISLVDILKLKEELKIIKNITQKGIDAMVDTSEYFPSTRKYNNAVTIKREQK